MRILFENQKQVEYDTEGVFDDILMRESYQRRNSKRTKEILQEVFGDEYNNGF